MSVKGFKLSDGTVVKYDYSYLDNIVTDDTLELSGVAADSKAVGDAIGDLNGLETTVKTNLVDAINEAANSGSDIEVDSSLSSTSENPVQNKTIHTALGSIQLGTDPITGLLYVYVNGKKQGTGIDIGAEGIDTSSLESFYKTPFLDALEYVDSLGSENWVHHVVTADNHYNGKFEDLKEQYPSTADEDIYTMMYNWNHSGAIIKLLMSTGYFDKYINLGDTTDKGNVEQLDLAIEQIGDLNGQMLYCIGNHEVSGANEITGLLYDAFMSELDPNVITYDSNFDPVTYNSSNYIYKDTEHKIAYIHYAYYRSSSDIPTWLWNAVDQIDDGWTVFFMSHEANGGTNVTTALKGIMNFTGLRKGFLLAGHIHVDGLADMGGYTRLVFDNDAKFNEEARAKDTAFEQAVSILSIGTGNNNAVKVYRIGAYASSFESTAPIIYDTQMTYNEPGSTFQAELNTAGQLNNVGTSGYRLIRKWFPTLPSTYYYIYDSRPFDKTATSGRALNYGAYSSQKLPSFVSGTRVSNTPDFHELYVRKIYTGANSNYMIIGVGNEERAGHLTMSTEPPQYDISIEDVDWVSGGSINSAGIPAFGGSGANYITDIPVLVKPSTRYVLDNQTTSAGWLAIGFAKGPCAINAVNSTRDCISRVTGSALPFTFTTPANAIYAYICTSSSATEGWTLTEQST